jgi:hypothetical protein
VIYCQVEYPDRTHEYRQPVVHDRRCCDRKLTSCTAICYACGDNLLQHDTKYSFKKLCGSSMYSRYAYVGCKLIPGPIHVLACAGMHLMHPANWCVTSAGCWTAVSQAACPAGAITFQTASPNVPSAWSAANQSAAGNTNTGALLPIATYGVELAGPGKNELWLHWQPVHPLLTVGAAVAADCAGASNVRRLLQADAATTTAATYTWSYTLDGVAAGGSQSPVSASTTPKITIQPWALNLANVSSLWQCSGRPV